MDVTYVEFKLKVLKSAISIITNYHNLYIKSHIFSFNSFITYVLQTEKINIIFAWLSCSCFTFYKNIFLTQILH